MTVALVVLCTSLGIGIAGMLVLGHYLEAKASEVQTTRVAASKAATLSPRISDLKSQEQRAAGYDRIFSLLIPTQEQLLEVPRVIEALGQVQGLETKFSFQGSPELGVTGVTKLPFTLTAKGPERNLADFLEDLEISNPRYLIAVDRVSLDEGRAGAESGVLSVGGSFFYHQ